MPVLKSNKIFFVPPHATSKVQPLEDGIIGHLKGKFCHRRFFSNVRKH